MLSYFVIYGVSFIVGCFGKVMFDIIFSGYV